MKFNLNKEIKAFDGTPVRNVENKMAQQMILNCVQVLEKMSEDHDDINDDFIEQYQRKAAEKVFGEAMTFRDAARSSLMRFKEGKQANEKDQLERYDLLIKLAADKVDLESKEIQTIRKAVANNYNQPIIVGRMRDLLEGKGKETKKD